MMKTLIFSCLALVLVLTSCGPAAEEKAKMMSSAKRTADSMANLIKTSMDAAAEGAGYPNIITPTAVTATVAPPATVAPNAKVK